jgi:hypothetical protein
MMNKSMIFLSSLMMLMPAISAQIETEWMDTATYPGSSHLLFFTNRPMIINDSGFTDFVDKYQYSTDTLTFGTYHPEADTFSIKFRAEYKGEEIRPVPSEFNFLYKVYDDMVVDKGIRHFEIMIPGYAKTFSNQRYDFMKRLKEIYADTLSYKVAFITYAWANEWRVLKYHKAKKSATAGAFDYYLFHHLLESFLYDTAFFQEHPRNFTIGLTCMSMGNELLKRFILEADAYGVELRKTYDHIMMIGSDASWDSFEPGQGFDRIDRLTDSVYLVMNRKDNPLIFSQVLNFKKRLGRHGPRKPWQAPDFLQTYDITGRLTMADMKGFNHDYLLRNTYLRNIIIDAYLMETETDPETLHDSEILTEDPEEQ